MSNPELNKAARLCIQTKSPLAVDDKKFFLEIQQAVLDGYRVCENTTMLDSCMRNFQGFIGQCVLYKEGQEYLEGSKVEKEEVKVEKTIEEEPVQEEKPSNAEVDGESGLDLEHLASLRTKVETLEYLTSKGIEVPEDLKTPSAIKKWVKDNK